MICLMITPFETCSAQVVGHASRYVLPITLHHWGWTHLLDDVIELVTGETSLEFLNAGRHIQVAHLCQLLLAVGIVTLVFCLGIQDLGERDGVV